MHPAKTEVRFSDEKAIFDLVYYSCKTALQQMGNITQAADRKPIKQNTVNPFTIHNVPLAGEQQRMTAQEYRQMIDAPAAPVSAAPVVPKVSVHHSSLYDGGFDISRDASKPQLNVRRAPSDQELWSGRALRQGAKSEGERPTPVCVETAVGEDPAVKSVLEQKDSEPERDRGKANVIFSTEKQSTPLSVEAEDQPRFSDCRQIGELLDTYILLERSDGLLLIDKHAAHERIIFEKLKKDNQNLLRQTLLAPVSVRLSREQYSAAIERMNVFGSLGFAVEDFGDGMLLIREVPLILTREDAAALVEEIAQRLAECNADPTPQVLDDLLHSVACRSAIKAGSHSHEAEQKAILEMLDADPTLRTCPHGRPIAVLLNKREIEKLFGRID